MTEPKYASRPARKPRRFTMGHFGIPLFAVIIGWAVYMQITTDDTWWWTITFGILGVGSCLYDLWLHRQAIADYNHYLATHPEEVSSEGHEDGSGPISAP